MAKVVTVVTTSGYRYAYEVDDAVAALINTGQQDIEFDTVDGYRVGLNRDNLVHIVIGDALYIVPQNVPQPPS